MCGINGLFGDMKTWQKNKKDYMYDAILTGATRGEDSTGLFMMPLMKKKNPIVYKKAMAGQEFVQNSRTKSLLEDLQNTCGIVAHNRSITRGYTDDESAHPFQHGDITLVHNGTVTNHGNLHKECSFANAKVDSDNVALAMSLLEPEVLLPKLEGGFSLVWWDTRDASLNFARNDLKPMNWIVSKDKKTLFFGSEVLHIWWLLWRSEIDADGEVLATKPLVHYKFTDANNLLKVERFPFKKASYPVVKGQAAATQKGTGTGTHTNTTKGWNKDQDAISQGTAQCIVNLLESKDEEKLATLRKLGQECKVAVGVPIMMRIHSWIPYVDKASKKEILGTTPGYLKMLHASSGKITQVFDITLNTYNKLIKEYASRHVPVTVEGYRSSIYHTDKQIVFVGTLRTDLKLKIPPVISTEKNLETLTEEKLYEIGVVKKRKVTLSVLKLVLSGGCHYCYRALTPDDVDGLDWHGNDEQFPCCPDCWNKLESNRSVN